MFNSLQPTGSLDRVGLVLSGGGAKGAYQVGVIKCLADYDFRIDVVAGASVGALNGAIVSAAPNLQEAAIRLEQIWTKISANPPVEIQTARVFPLAASLYLAFLFAFDRGASGDLIIDPTLKLLSGESFANVVADNNILKTLVDFFIGSENKTTLSELIGRYLDNDALAKGLPLFVSVFRSSGVLVDLYRLASCAIRISDVPDSEFIHLQSMGKEEFIKCILASSALPLICETQVIGKASFVDGGIGGWLRSQGNTPITPLLGSCRYIIVTHLTDGSMWDRNAFPDATIIEIRPGKLIARKGGMRDTLGFEIRPIQEWMQQGYEDAERCLLRIKTIVDVEREARAAHLNLLDAISRLQKTSIKPNRDE